MKQGASQEQGQHAAPDACEAYFLEMMFEMLLEMMFEMLLELLFELLFAVLFELLFEQKAQDTPLEGGLFGSYR